MTLDADQPAPSGAGAGRVHAKTVRVRLLPHEDADFQYSQGVISNFTGNEFLITFVQYRPPAFGAGEEVPDEIPAKVLIRLAMSPLKWAEAVDSFAKQIAQFRADGILPPAPDQK